MGYKISKFDRKHARKKGSRYEKTMDALIENKDRLLGSPDEFLTIVDIPADKKNSFSMSMRQFVTRELGPQYRLKFRSNRNSSVLYISIVEKG